ncbi:MAG: hypothetical protein E6I91_14170 [Chloroflexi bacterium]|nr:MAG: hypothetical protein E6I91_14170 [Chloroflexota bacterium]
MTFVKMRMSQPQIVLEAVLSTEITALQERSKEDKGKQEEQALLDQQETGARASSALRQLRQGRGQVGLL